MAPSEPTLEQLENRGIYMVPDPATSPIAQAEAAVVEAAMEQMTAKRDMRKGDRSFKARAERAWRHACVVTEAACAAFDRARKGDA